MAELTRDFKGVWIPKEIWLDERLNALDKIILAEIDSLDNDETGCFAGNPYIAEFCQCSESKVSKAISKLVELGYLSVQGFDGRQRILKSCLVNYAKQPIKKCEAAYQNMPEINIDNNINNNISSNSEKFDESEEENQLSLVEDTDNVKSEKKSDNDHVHESSLKEVAEEIYKQYPRKEGKAKGFELIRAYLVNGRTFSGVGKVKFNHEQLFCAVRDYAMDCEENHTEKQFIQMFSTFMNKTVVDYVEKSSKGYEEYMRRKYGDEWKKLKFTYK